MNAAEPRVDCDLTQTLPGTITPVKVPSECDAVPITAPEASKSASKSGSDKAPKPKVNKREGANVVLSRFRFWGTASKSGSDKAPKPKVNKREGANVVLSPFRFWGTMCSICIAVFLFALDQLIIATAIPHITAEFNALTQLPWLASGFL
jgi:hypothetical protein